MTDDQYEALMSPQPTAMVRSILHDPNWVKCERCRHFHTVKLNFDNLCDRCCHSILEGWPEHWSVPFIKASFASQRAHFSRPALSADNDLNNPPPKMIAMDIETAP